MFAGKLNNWKNDNKDHGQTDSISSVKHGINTKGVSIEN